MQTTIIPAINKLIEATPSLSDTLALTLNDEALETIQKSRKEYQAGKGIPVEDVLKNL